MAAQKNNLRIRKKTLKKREYNFNDKEIKKWLNVFYTRFFRQQFKRNCMPDGVKVGTVSVSPRGDLRLPSEIELDDFILLEETPTYASGE